MSSPKIISWLPIKSTLIAPSQSLAAAGNLVLNSKVPGQPQGAFIYDKVIRQVRLTSTANENGVAFTIRGIGTPIDPVTKNPTDVLKFITEIIPNGPNIGAPVDSVNIFSQIISISANNVVVNISVGSGPAGITDYVFLDYNRTMFQAAAQLQFNPRTTATVTVYQSLSKPQIIDINAGNLIDIKPIPEFLVTALNVTTDQLEILKSPVALTWATVIASTTDLINFTVLQQGIN